MTAYLFDGHDACGIHHDGATDDPTAKVDECMTAGWRDLTVTHAGRVVGRIHTEYGKDGRAHRMSWAGRRA